MPEDEAFWEAYDELLYRVGVLLLTAPIPEGSYRWTSSDGAVAVLDVSRGEPVDTGAGRGCAEPLAASEARERVRTPFGPVLPQHPLT